MKSIGGPRFSFSAITVLAIAAVIAYGFVFWQGTIQKSLEKSPIACSTASANFCQIGTYCKAAAGPAQIDFDDQQVDPKAPNGQCAPIVYRALDAATLSSGTGN